MEFVEQLFDYGGLQENYLRVYLGSGEKQLRCTWIQENMLRDVAVLSDKYSELYFASVRPFLLAYNC